VCRWAQSKAQARKACDFGLNLPPLFLFWHHNKHSLQRATALREGVNRFYASTSKSIVAGTGTERGRVSIVTCNLPRYLDVTCALPLRTRDSGISAMRACHVTAFNLTSTFHGYRWNNDSDQTLPKLISHDEIERFRTAEG